MMIIIAANKLLNGFQLTFVCQPQAMCTTIVGMFEPKKKTFFVFMLLIFSVFFRFRPLIAQMLLPRFRKYFGLLIKENWKK